MQDTPPFSQLWCHNRGSNNDAWGTNQDTLELIKHIQNCEQVLDNCTPRSHSEKNSLFQKNHIMLPICTVLRKLSTNGALVDVDAALPLGALTQAGKATQLLQTWRTPLEN